MSELGQYDGKRTLRRSTASAGSDPLLPFTERLPNGVT